MLIGIIAVNYRMQYNNQVVFQEETPCRYMHKHRQLQSLEFLHSKGLPNS